MQADTTTDAVSGPLRGNDTFLQDAASFERSSRNSACDVGDEATDEFVSFGTSSGEESNLSGSPIHCDVAIDPAPIEGTQY